ncbi:sugar transferase [Aquabacter spiritensis]|uniref:Lipopolysaccharide/colanic/teichoic acid biosynthesis glycosyltransferase n=1 Tax=Aquabacter spiritensis TaxID=933073 RepID=A0A4R3LVA7_9HYPH|nr:sugar transferase [Aquabacter spiritensis]TCT03976.1 lipopolysaccharide/colanic/teichoic acid biosynthesis glycosyltransferase [Aquabacter spiritensis]
MRSARSLALDLFLISLGTVSALILRDNFDVSWDRLANFAPYIGITLLVSCGVLPALGISRSSWQFASAGDHLRIVAAAVIIVAASVTIGFIGTRLDDVARSLPIIQGMLIIFLLSGLRAWLGARRGAVDAVTMPHHPHAQTGVIIGLNRFTELYLQCVGEFAKGRIRIAGLLAERERVGLSVLSYPVIGTPEALDEALRQLEIHGVTVDCVLVAGTVESLSPEARAALVRAQAERPLQVEYLADRLVPPLDKAAAESEAHLVERAVHGDAESYLRLLVHAPRPSYHALKRVMDGVGAAILLMLLWPVMFLVALVVVLDLGLPVLFWQQRPGLNGRPFKLFKFRTMAAAYDAQGRRRSDEERASRLGSFLRRTRLDELPQLVNILRGEMSFVGPRPLLSSDQTVEHAGRLQVRPGLTGWAQIKGGRRISTTDKAALDIWYANNISLLLDVAIVFGTVRMLVLGEQVRHDAIIEAWRDLGVVYSVGDRQGQS